MTVKIININGEYDELPQNKEANLIRDINLDKAKTELNKLENKLEKLRKMASELRNNLDEGHTENIDFFLSYLEKCLLESKHLDIFSREIEREILDANDYNSLLVEGKTHSVVSKLHVEKNDIFSYILPEMFGKRNKIKGTYRGVFIGNIVARLTLEHLKTLENNFNKMEKALVVFEHHIDINDDISSFSDPDNIDAKKALDGINGLIIEDDTMKNINLLHLTVASNTPCTIMHVIRQNKVKIWVKNNIDLFEKNVIKGKS